MFPLELAAYPVLMGAIFVAYRVGKGREVFDERFEWLRVGILALLLGILVTVQWHLYATGIVGSTTSVALGTIGIACTLSLVALHLLEFYDRKSGRRTPWLTR